MNDQTHSKSTSWKDLFQFESHFAEVNGHRMHYIDEGAGDPMLFVHGNPTWSFYWRELVKAFSKKQRCLAIDHIGMGFSDKPRQYNYCLQQHIDNLNSFVTNLDLHNITLVMHDWGGAIGSGTAVSLPDRIKRIVLLNTAFFRPPYVPKRIRLVHIPAFGSWAVRGMNGFCKAAVKMATHLPQGLSEPVKQGLLAPYDNWANRIGVYKFVMDIPRSSQHPTWQTLDRIENGMAQFKNHPSLLIWGMQDWCFRRVCLERIKETLPNADIVEITEAGHYVVEDAPTKVIESINVFLAKNSN